MTCLTDMERLETGDNMRRVTTSIFALLLSFAIVGAANAFTEADVDQSFYPYKDGVPEYPGYQPGMTITQENVDLFKEILDPALYSHVKAGWVALKTKETEDLVLHPNYIKATRDAVTSPPSLSSDGLVDNFVAGRAFPVQPDANDPNAGIKLAWNYQYGYNWGDNAAICPFYWKLRDVKTAKIERTFKWCFHFLNWKHRVNQDPVPEFSNNPGKLFRSIYARVLEPFDVGNTQLLIHRYKNDLKQDNAWLYLGFQRRVRRLATGQKTDSFLGTDIMIEDFEGYNSRVSDYDWTFVETKNTFLPFHRHNELELSTQYEEADGYRYVDFEGKGGCFPKTTWELRKVHLLEATAKDGSHPIGRRLMFIDAQTATIPRQNIFDRKGDLWKSFSICQANPEHHHPDNKGSGVAIDDCFMVMDVQTQHCTTGQFQGLLDPSLNPPDMFTVQNLRRAGS